MIVREGMVDVQAIRKVIADVHVVQGQHDERS